MKKNNTNKKANVEVKAASVEDTREVWELIPTVDELNEVDGEENTATEQTEMTIEEIAANFGIKVNWTADQKARWLDGVEVDENGKIKLIIEDDYKGLPQHEGWNEDYHALKKGKLSRVGRNFALTLIKIGAAYVVENIAAKKAREAAEKAKAKAEKAAARQAKKAESTK